MFRDEKTGRFVAEKPVEWVCACNKEKEDYGFYSKVLNKVFDTLQDLRAAEAEHAKNEAEKKAASEARKVDASKVEEAFKVLNNTKANYNKGITLAYKQCRESIADARETLNTSLKQLQTGLNNAEKAYNTALAEFTKAHPEGYHVTLKDGDNVVTLTNSTNPSSAFMNRFFDWFINNDF